MDFNINSDNFSNTSDEKLEEIIQHYPPGHIGSSTPYSRALAEKHRRQKTKVEAEDEWRKEVQKRLDELKRPHRPSFWLLVASVTLALVAAIAAILALPQAQQAFFKNQQFLEKKEPLPQDAQKSVTQKPNMPKK